MRRRRFGAGCAVRGLALAGLLTICGAPAGGTAQAFEPPPASKNFTTPSSVPNYFSNEAAPFGRGPRTAQPGADRFNIAPTAASGGYAATAQPTRGAAASAGREQQRSRSARGRTGRPVFVSSRAGRAYVAKPRGRAALGRPSTTAASRKSAATRQRAAASPTRSAAYGTRHASRSSR